MKEPWEWDESDLLNLVTTKIRESLTLEYKGSDALKDSKEISKDVSAFANAAGGILVYGISEDKDHFTIDIDKGSDPRGFSQETLENIITSRIHPKINGLRIQPVELKTRSTGNFAYVVYIPQSTTAHMADGYRYYKRHNFKAQPMEDYELRDVMRRSTVPDLSLKFSLTALGDQYVNDKGYYKGNVALFNRSDTPAEYSVVSLYLDANIEVRNSGDFSIRGVTTVTHNNTQNLVCHLQRSLSLSMPGGLPIWKGIDFAVSPNFTIGIPKENDKIYLCWYEIFSPGMQRKDGLIRILWNGTVLEPSHEEVVLINHRP